MASRPVYTSTAEGFRDEKEIAGLRPMAAPKPRAPRKASNPALRQVTNGIVCFCGERFGEAQSLEFMLHLRAEVGEDLALVKRRRKGAREWARRARQDPERREQQLIWQREYRARNREAIKERDRIRKLDPEYRERRRKQDRARRARKKAEREAGMVTSDH